jgi:hypothetical protein
MTEMKQPFSVSSVHCIQVIEAIHDHCAQTIARHYPGAFGESSHRDT